MLIKKKVQTSKSKAEKPRAYPEQNVFYNGFWYSLFYGESSKIL